MYSHVLACKCVSLPSHQPLYICDLKIYRYTLPINTPADKNVQSFILTFAFI